jgi:outer membrane protein OmpA-like peptidoglycan-associated protein
MTIRARFLAAVTLAGVAALPRVAGAADCSPASRLSTCIDSDNLWPKAGPSLFTSVGGATITPPGQMSFGLVTSFQKRPLSLRLPSADPAGTVVPLVDNQFDATFLWSVGLGSRFELTVAAPVTLFQDGFGLSAVTDQKPTELVRTAIRDPRLGLTYALVPRPVTTADGLAVAVRTDVTLPTGDRDVYASGGSFVGIPAIAAEWRSGRLAIAAEAGARLRSTHELAGTRIGSQLVESVGASWDVRPNELLAVTAEVFSLQTLASQSTTTRDATGALVDGPSRAMNAPTEWLAGLRSAPALAGDVTLHAAFGTSIPLSDNDATQPRYRFVGGVRYAPLGRDRDGDGILDRDDKCPDQPEDRDGFEDEDGCPDPDNDRDGIPDSQDMCPNGPEDVDGFKDEDGCPDPDNDLDGIPDKQDKCPNEPEDKDGFEDDDGCPDPDNDQDGILDKNDKCPNEAETINGIDDEDGCPEPNAKDQTKVVGDRVLVEPPLRFARGSAKLAPDAVKGLAMSAQRARGIRDVERVVVEVYGDAGSPAAQQEKLAGQRADAVKTALEGAGLPGLVVVAGDPGEKRKADAPHVSFQVVVKKRKAPR